jgi:transposase, IS5 family
VAIVDRGYKGVAVEGVKFLSSRLEAWRHAWTTNDDPTAQCDRAGHRSHEDGRQIRLV